MGPSIVIIANPDELHLSIVNEGNHEVLFHSEDYSRKWNRNRAARSIAKHTGWPIKGFSI